MHLGFMFIGAIFWFVVLGAIALLVIWAVRSASPSRPPSAVSPAPMRETPLDILARRFAAGEINAEDYKRARDLLAGGGKT